MLSSMMRLRFEIGAGDVAIDLRHHRPGAQCREHIRAIIARLWIEHREVDALLFESSRRTGLQPPERQVESVEAFCQSDDRGLPDPPGRRRNIAAVDDAAQKGAGCQHDSTGGNNLTRAKLQPGNSIAFEQDFFGFGGEDIEIVLRPERRQHLLFIERPIHLRPRSAHRRPFATVEQTKLDTRAVGDTRHHAVKSIDLADKMPLPQPTDSRVAAHFPDGVYAMGDQQCACTKPRRGSRCLAAGVPASDDNYIRILHGRHGRFRRSLFDRIRYTTSRTIRGCFT